MSYNLEITQGTDYTRTFTVTDSLNVAVNISGFTFKSHIRRNHNSSEYVEFTFTITNAVLGKVTMSLSNTITDTLEGKYVYDIFMTDSDTKRHEIENGIITVKQKITHVI